MAQKEYALPKLHPGQAKVMRSKARFRILACGRRWGKSFLCAIMCILRANKGQKCWWVAPTYDQGVIGWDMLLAVVSQIPTVQIALSTKMVTFPSGGTIQIKSADKPDNLRGVGLDFLVMDECAWVVRRTWYEILRPALADKRGEAVFISTPRGRDWFFELFQYGLVPDQNDYESFRFPTTSNPFIPADEVEAAKKSTDSRTFRQEFLAEFIEDAGGVFRKVREAATAAVTDKAISTIEEGGKVVDHVYMVGVDWGRKHDYTVFAVLDCNTHEIVHVDRFSGVEYRDQRLRLQGLYNRFRPILIVCESNAMGEPVIEQLLEDGLPVYPFSTQIRSKMEIIDNLALGLDAELLKIPDEEAVIGEMQAYEGKRTRTGMMSYGAPEGLHDDIVMAIALVWHYGHEFSPMDFKVTRREFVL
jgi:hypothetical protein